MWAPCILETYIGNYVVWKHHLRLETKNVYWKHTQDIGNKNWILETYIGYWKQKLDIGNIRIILETQGYILETLHLET